MSWCFAIINGRLTEMFFYRKKGIQGHCYVKREDYNKTEQNFIKYSLYPLWIGSFLNIFANNKLGCKDTEILK